LHVTPSLHSPVLTSRLRRPAPGRAAWTSLAALDQAGGLISGDDLALRLRGQVSQPLSLVAQWIVQRKVINLNWRSGYVLPMFQFDPVSMAPRPSLADVLAELSAAYDDWDIVDWFLRPNSLLQDKAPATVLGADGTAVVQAARADRYIASL
jgi:hypothetical protein